MVSVRMIMAPEPQPPQKVEEKKPEPPKPKPKPQKKEKVRPKYDPKKEALKEIREMEKKRKKAALPTPTPKKKPKPVPTPDPRFKPLTETKAKPTSAPVKTKPLSEDVPFEFASGERDPGYADRLTRAIMVKWNKPTAQNDKQYECVGTVEFDIRSNGAVINIEITEASGWNELDDSIKKAIEDVGTVGAPPRNLYSGSTLGVRYQFRLKKPGTK